MEWPRHTRPRLLPLGDSAWSIARRYGVTTRRLLEDILAMEERHADDLVDLLQDLPKE